MGTGLIATYYWQATGSPNATERTWTDEQINFDWGEGNPTHGAWTVPSNNFSVRWTGFVQPQYTERYKFYTFSDDGVKLWINNQLIISHWNNHPAVEDQPLVELDLVAGVRYPVVMMYYENEGAATAKLRWESASQAKEVIPSNRLYPGVPATTMLQGPAGQGGSVPTGSQPLRWLVDPDSKATSLAGVPFWRQSGPEVLTMPLDTRPWGVGTDTYWNGVVPPGAFVGPSGAGPCVGIALIPSDRTQPTYILHLSSQAIVTQSFLYSGFAINSTEVRQGYRAFLCGAAKPAGNPADPLFQQDDKSRLYTLQDVVKFLRFHDVPIAAYLPTFGFAVDSSGWVYWSESPGSPEQAQRFEE